MSIDRYRLLDKRQFHVRGRAQRPESCRYHFRNA